MSGRKLRRALLVLVGAGAVVGLLWLGWGLVGGGVNRLEQWCGRQLLSIANDHLGPTLSFNRLTYTYPRSVTLAKVRLSADGVSIVEADAIGIDFAEIPRIGRPVVIAAARFERPVVRLLEGPDGALLGFSNFVKTGAGRELPDGGSTRLSDVLDIKTLQVDGGAVSYKRPRQPLMRLRPLTFEMHHQPPAAGDAASEPGWYDFVTRLALEPVVNLDLDARLNLDTAVLDVTRAVLATALTAAQYEVFPAQVQDILRQYGIVGDLEWTFSGQVPLGDAATSAIDTQLSLHDASVAFGAYVLPAESIQISARLSDGRLDVSQWSMRSLGGTAQVSAHVRLAGPQSGSFEAQGEGQQLRLEQAFRYEKGEAAKYRGSASFHVDVHGDFDDLAGTFAGSGDLEIRDAHLGLVDLFRGTLGIVGHREDRDYGTAEFVLTPDRVRWSDVKVGGTTIGIDGGGDLHYDGRLDCLFNVGPLQGREGLLGFIGDAVGIVTDRLVKYKLTGTVDEPKVAVRPLGVGGNKPE
jgi:hypothetical protein